MTTETQQPRPSWVQRSGLNLLLTGLTILASYWAAQGWAAVSRDWLAMKGPEAYLLFGLFEGVVIALILIATRTRLAGDAAAFLWSGVWLLTSLAVAVQVYHALGTSRPQSALIYGTATLVVVLLWQIKTRQVNREALRAAGLVAAPSVSLGSSLWLRFPRWAWRAQTVARWEGLTQPAVALRRAQQLYPSGSMPWDRAHQRAASKAGGAVKSQAASQGAGKGSSQTAGKATAPAPVKAARHTGVRPAGQGAGDTPLLTKARTFAIKHRAEKGRLPGVEPLRKHLRIGQDAAKDLRDQVNAELSKTDDSDREAMA